jgi:hypothetical protein
MNFLRNFFRLYTDTRSYNLGRWTIHYEPRIIELKTKQANEDHCGCCFDIVKDKKSNTNIDSLVCIVKQNNSIMKIKK